MKLPTLRGRGLRPSTMKARARRRLNLSDISHSRIRLFLAEARQRPQVALATEPPATVAIVVPCFSHAPFLPEMLASIEAQTRLPDEVVFVDDASPDATSAILERFVREHQGRTGPRLTLLANARNCGQAASLNRAIEATSSDLIMILNDDDYLMHDAVETALGVFERHPDLGLVGGGNIGFGAGRTLDGAAKLSTDYVPDSVPVRIRYPSEVASYRRPDALNMTHSSSCFRRVAWTAAGGYYSDKRRRVVPYSDRDFQLRVNALFPVGVLETRPLAFWRNDSSVDRHVNS